MADKSEEYKFINAMKALAILLVLLGHALDDYERLRTPLGAVGTDIVTMMFAVNVPLFFLIGGYLSHPQPLGGYLRKKLLRVLVPYVFFTLLKLLYRSAADRQILTLAQLWRAVKMGSQYWFPPALLLVYLAAPLFWKRRTRTLLLLAAVFAVVQCFLFARSVKVSRVFRLTNALFELPFFLLGMAAAREKERLRRWLRRPGVTVPTAAVAAGLVMAAAHANGIVSVKNAFPFDLPLALALTVLLCYPALALRGTRTADAMGRWSYQLFLMEGFFRSQVFPLLRPWLSVPLVLVLTAVNILLCLLLCHFLQKLPVVKALVGL